MPGGTIVNSPSKSGANGSAQPPGQQQLANFSQALANASPYQHGQSANQNRNRNVRTHHAAFGGGTPQKSESQGGNDQDAEQRRVMKGPSSTMSKAGE
jgi:hypothetical protein